MERSHQGGLVNDSLDCADGPTEPTRRFLVRQTVDITQRQRLAVRIRQAIKFLTNHMSQLGRQLVACQGAGIR